MMGLLDSIGIEGPEWADGQALTQGLLALAKNRKRPFTGLLEALATAEGVMGQAKDKDRKQQLEDEQRKQIAEERGLRMQQLQEAMADKRDAKAQEQTDMGLLRGMMQPQAGPVRPGEAMPNTSFDPSAFLAQRGSLGGLQNAMALNAQMQGPKPEIRSGKDPLIQLMPDGSVRKLYEGAQEAPKPPSAVQEYEFAKEQGYPGSFLDFQLTQKRAGATSVSVNTGQKGLDNTLKLRGDFRSEPIYKAHQEVQSAYAQITEGLNKKSPAGDLAGATKIMKILDPTSVVRESELGMALAATGLFDRVGNYANMVMKGEKLTPSQRSDFLGLAKQLNDASAKQYNAKRSEYQGIAERNGLSVADVLGPESKPENAARTVVRTGMRNGKRVVQYSDGTVEDVSGAGASGEY